MRPYLHLAAPDHVKMEECVKRLKTTRAFPASALKDGKVSTCPAQYNPFYICERLECDLSLNLSLLSFKVKRVRLTSTSV